jgi:hypothetical protein
MTTYGPFRLYGPSVANDLAKSWIDKLKATDTGSLIVGRISNLVGGSKLSIVFADPLTIRTFGLPSLNPWTCFNNGWPNRGYAKGQPTNSWFWGNQVPAGTPAGPLDVYVGWLKDYYCSVPEGTNPRFVWLGHELVHAIHFLSGQGLGNFSTHDKACKEQTDNLEEARTIGRREPGYLYETLSENSLRAELGLPLRDSHCTLPDPSTPGSIDKGTYYNPTPVFTPI